MTKKLTFLLAGLMLATGLLATGASGATTLGSSLALPVDDGVWCPPGERCTVFQLALPGRTAAAPANGVIVRWRIKTDGAPTPYSLRVGRPIGSALLGVGGGPDVNLGAGEHSFDVRIPVLAGDVIGVEFGEDGGRIKPSGAGVPGALAPYYSPYLPIGESREPTIVNLDSEYLINADFEPDADGDGYGDESQDKCAGVKGEFGGCLESVAPVLKRSAAKRQRIGKLSATASINEAGRIDARASVKFKSGKKNVTVSSKLVKRNVGAGIPARLPLKFSKSQRKKLAALIASGRKPVAQINFTATDLAGNKTRATLKVRLKR